VKAGTSCMEKSTAASVCPENRACYQSALQSSGEFHAYRHLRRGFTRSRASKSAAHVHRLSGSRLLLAGDACRKPRGFADDQVETKNPRRRGETFDRDENPRQAGVGAARARTD